MTGATLTAAASAKEPDTLSSDMYLAGTLDGINYIYTDDGGNTWMSEAEYQEKNPYVVDELEFWEIDEFEAWMEQQKTQYQALVDDGAPGWTQKDVDELYAVWRNQLDQMKMGYEYMKSIELSDGHTLVGAFEPDTTGVSTSPSSTVITMPDGTTVNLGSFDTPEKAEAAVKKYLDEQVKAGVITQQEAGEILQNSAKE